MIINDPPRTVEMIKCAVGEISADLVIQNGIIANVLTKELINDSLAVKSGRIARIGSCTDIIGKDTNVIDADGKIISPGFIESHIHVESSMLTLTQFSAAIAPHGTTTTVIDPHEIANVLGARGVRLLIEEKKQLPLRYLIEVPSCVPAVSGFENAGAELNAKDVAELLKEDTFGLAEMMNFPGVFLGVPEVLEKINSALQVNKIVEGHAPGVSGNNLNAYIGAGISSDHEATTIEEGLEKLRLGMKLQIREGSFAKDLETIIKGIIEARIDTRNCLIVSDDRHPHDLVYQGHLDHSLRLAVKTGLDPLIALQMVTINVSQHIGLSYDIGSIAPGKIADITIFDNVEDFIVQNTIFKGQEIAREGKLIKELPTFFYPEWALDTVHVKPIPNENELKIPWKGSDSSVKARIIGVLEHSLLTENLVAELRVENGYIVPDVTNDILPIVVIERHNKLGTIGSGFIKNFGLPNGALASSIGHDSHNIIAVGSTYDYILKAVEQLIANKGGLVAITNDSTYQIALPFAGIMTTEKPEVIATKLREMDEYIDNMGVKISSPFMALSFLALPVIPHLKLTDKGLVDVDAFEMVPVVIRE